MRRVHVGLASAGLAAGLLFVLPAPATASPSSAARTCATGALTVSVVTPSTSYQREQPVPFTLSVHNSGSYPCRPTGCIPTVQVDTSAGVLEWSSLPPGFGTCAMISSVPAHGYLRSSFTWDQRPNEPAGCLGGGRCPVVPPGSYRASGYAGGQASRPVLFRIVATAARSGRVAQSDPQLPHTGTAVPWLLVMAAALGVVGITLKRAGRRDP